MNRNLNIWVMGGDRRQVELACQLSSDGHTVHAFALAENTPKLIPEQSLSDLEKADCLIFPLPVSRSSGLLNAPGTPTNIPLVSIFAQLSSRHLLFGGLVGADVQELAANHGLTIHDYFAREELTIANAVPTAEGALQLAMEHLPITIHGAQTLIIGFGRVGRITAQRFAALGADVRIAARKKEQLAWAEAIGLSTIHLSQFRNVLPQCDLLINTAPACILGTEELTALRPDCPILDLASSPGGVDPDTATQLNRILIRAPGLPGKVAPVTAGLAIKNTIYNMLLELGQ